MQQRRRPNRRAPYLVEMNEDDTDAADEEPMFIYHTVRRTTDGAGT